MTIDGVARRVPWYPTSREKRARCGAPDLMLPVQKAGQLIFQFRDQSVDGASPRLFRPMYAGANMGHPSSGGRLVCKGGVAPSGTSGSILIDKDQTLLPTADKKSARVRGFMLSLSPGWDAWDQNSSRAPGTASRPGRRGHQAPASGGAHGLSRAAPCRPLCRDQDGLGARSPH
jgi:hypothetical protein